MGDSENAIIVGIATSPNSSQYFTNEEYQQAFYLYRMFQGVPGVNPLLVFLPRADDEPEATADLFGEPAYNLNLFTTKFRLDALVLAGVVPSAAYLDIFRKNGVKIAALVGHNRYGVDQQVAAFGHLSDEKGKKGDNVLLRREHLQPDAVWIPSHLTSHKDYIQHRYSAQRAYVSPYIWDSELVDKQFASHPKFKHGSPQFSKHRHQNKQVFCADSGFDNLRSLIFAYKTAVLAEANSPKCFTLLRLYNSRHQFEHNDALLHYLTATSGLLEEKRLALVVDKPFPEMVKRCGVMLQHQHNPELNYSLLEGAHLRLPIVHNSSLARELGYYYPGTNLTAASRQLTRALLHEERSDLEKYDKSCEGVLRKYSIHNTDNRRGYQTLLANLLNKRLTPVLSRSAEESDGYISPFY